MEDGGRMSKDGDDAVLPETEASGEEDSQQRQHLRSSSDPEAKGEEHPPPDTAGKEGSGEQVEAGDGGPSGSRKPSADGTASAAGETQSAQGNTDSAAGSVIQEGERKSGSVDSGGAAFGLPEVASTEKKSQPVHEKQVRLFEDVGVKVRVELGRGKMRLRDVLRLTHGSVVELEKLAGDPLEIYVNERLIAKGEVLVLNENFCVRITEIFSPEEVLRARSH